MLVKFRVCKGIVYGNPCDKSYKFTFNVKSFLLLLVNYIQNLIEGNTLY